MKRVKKYFFGVVLLFFTLSLFMNVLGKENDQDLEIEKNNNYQNMCVDIQVNEDGYYSLMSDVEVHYDNDKISYISLKEPTLLSFAISSKHENAVWLLDQSKGEAFINELMVINEELKNQGNHELSKKVEAIISQFASIGPITGAST